MAAILYDDKAVRRLVRKFKEEISNPRQVYADLARTARDYVRETITLQGRNTPWPGLSQWTKSRTGRRKALIAIRPLIKAKWSNSSAEVYFDAPSTEWNLDQHNTGFSVRGVQHKRMVVPSKSGGILAVFTKRKPVKVPRRRVYPTQREMESMVSVTLKEWAERLDRLRA